MPNNTITTDFFNADDHFPKDGWYVWRAKETSPLFSYRFVYVQSGEMWEEMPLDVPAKKRVTVLVDRRGQLSGPIEIVRGSE